MKNKPLRARVKPSERIAEIFTEELKKKQPPTSVVPVAIDAIIKYLDEIYAKT